MILQREHANANSTIDHHSALDFVSEMRGQLLSNILEACSAHTQPNFPPPNPKPQPFNILASSMPSLVTFLDSFDFLPLPTAAAWLAVSCLICELFSTSLPESFVFGALPDNAPLSSPSSSSLSSIYWPNLFMK